MSGKFTGSVEVTWLANRGADRDMRLNVPFGFTDAQGIEWNVPEGAVVNGASIPRVFWTSFGPPFVGDYRRATVVHDYFCLTRERTDKATHRMFYHACRVGGVGPVKASAMYAAVATFGPHWETADGTPGIYVDEDSRTRQLLRTMSEHEYNDMQNWIENDAPDLDAIDKRIDELAPLSRLQPVGS